MADDTAAPEPSLVREICATPGRFTFFQAVRVLTAAAKAVPAPATGQAVLADLRLRSNDGLSFPARDIAAAERIRPRRSDGSAGHGYALHVNFLGLYGPSSPLPLYFSEQIIAGDDEAALLRDFLDVFNHRLLTLLWEAWKRSQLVAECTGRLDDAISARILSLFGLDRAAPPFRENNLYWTRMAQGAGGLTMSARSPAMLESILTAVFPGTRFRVEEFLPRKVTIPADQRARLGQAGSSLGRDIFLGEEVADRGGKMGLAIGPLDMKGYRSFLPGTVAFYRVLEVTGFAVKRPLDIAISLDLAEGEARPLRLGDPATAQLGWTGWLGAPAPVPHRLSVAQHGHKPRDAGAEPV